MSLHAEARKHVFTGGVVYLNRLWRPSNTTVLSATWGHWTVCSCDKKVKPADDLETVNKIVI